MKPTRAYHDPRSTIIWVLAYDADPATGRDRVKIEKDYLHAARRLGRETYHTIEDAENALDQARRKLAAKYLTDIGRTVLSILEAAKPGDVRLAGGYDPAMLTERNRLRLNQRAADVGVTDWWSFETGTCRYLGWRTRMDVYRMADGSFLAVETQNRELVG